MVNTDQNIGDVANIKKLNKKKKEGNYDNVKKPKKGTV